MAAGGKNRLPKMMAGKINPADRGGHKIGGKIEKKLPKTAIFGNKIELATLRTLIVEPRFLEHIQSAPWARVCTFWHWQVDAIGLSHRRGTQKSMLLGT